MIRPTIIALLAAPAFAGNADTWGSSRAALQLCHEADACLTVINQLSAAPDVVDTVLTLDGLQVRLHVVMGIGETPDRVQVIAPPGWLVDPLQADMPEGGMMVFRLYAPQVSDASPAHSSRAEPATAASVAVALSLQALTRGAYGA